MSKEIIAADISKARKLLDGAVVPMTDRIAYSPEQKLIEYKPVVQEDMTLGQADIEKRYGRIVFQWGMIQDTPLVQVSSMLRYFFPVEVHLLGEDAYVYIGLSPLFRPLANALKDMKMEDVPFYMLEQEEGSGNITAVEIHIEKNRIKKPTKEEVKRHG